MKKRIQKILSAGNRFYAILCDAEYNDDLLLCGVYPSLKEAKEVAEDIKECPCKHRIVKCSCAITYEIPHKKISNTKKKV